jgi:5-methyltetrahydrofolate--homocysteine methyltransferase
MQIEKFISVGENIHCTRIYKVGGKFVREVDGGAHAIVYRAGDQTRHLPIPDAFVNGPDWEAGKVKHCGVAIWQGNYGEGEAREAGADYIRNMARRQEAAGATYLDINVDEFSTDTEERARLMTWTVETAQAAVGIPMSIDSSNTDILRAGLKACDTARGRPMVNSVSLERVEAIGVAAEYGAVVVASAAGENDLPTTTGGRLANVDALMPGLTNAGFEPGDIHLDPLVFPIAVDGGNGTGFLNAVSEFRRKYGERVHIVAGLSNISFGMPGRKLINQVFTRLAVEHGADGGIVDPIQINIESLNALDTESEAFQLAKALLLGEDEFGMNFIMASREGKLTP